jgi:tetratricopeptide (TPR) repeat protein
MTLALLLALLGASLQAEPGQTGGDRPSSVQATDPVAEAYRQFLLAQRYESAKDVDNAVAAYERAMAADPKAGAIPAALADLQMRANRLADAVKTATHAIEVEPGNREAHRVLGLIYASAATKESPRTPASRQAQQDSLQRAIRHLEAAVTPAGGITDAEAGLRDTLARVYMIAGRYESAIPILVELVRWDPLRSDLARLLAEAYAAANRGGEAITWLESAASDNPQLYGTLADFYGRDGRSKEASGAYEQALKTSPRGFDVRVRYASMLLNVRGAANMMRARDVLREAVALRPTDERALYLLSEAERQTGDVAAAEAAARRLIAQNALNPRGYSSLAEALADRRRYQDVVDALVPAVVKFRATSDPSLALGILLPRLANAHQQLGRHDAAIAVYEELRTLSKDPAATIRLIQAHLAAKRYTAALEIARSARVERPDDVWLARLESETLRQDGKADEAIAVLGSLVARRGDNPEAHIALANVYAETDRSVLAVKILQDAETKFPADTAITFELGAALERQKQYAAAEAAFRRVIDREPEHAPALNYLGYMLADRGERLDESVDLITRALEVDPRNGSYLDSLGWAYFKGGRLQLAEQHLRQAAEQLATNSVVQDHYGDVLFKLERYQEAVDAWLHALGGDGDSIDRDDIDRKIRSARQRLDRR